MPRGVYDRSKAAAPKGAAPKTTSPKAAPKAAPAKSPTKTVATPTQHKKPGPKPGAKKGVKASHVAEASHSTDLEKLSVLNGSLTALAAAAENASADVDSAIKGAVEKISSIINRIEPAIVAAPAMEAVEAPEQKRAIKAPPAIPTAAPPQAAQAPFVAPTPMQTAPQSAPQAHA